MNLFDRIPAKADQLAYDLKDYMLLLRLYKDPTIPQNTLLAFNRHFLKNLDLS